MNYELRIMNYELRIMNYELRIMNFKLKILNPVKYPPKVDFTGQALCFEY